MAIPHGMPENVIQPKIFVIKLTYPVNWGGKMVNVIFLLALNFNNIETTKAFFSDFLRIVSSEEKLDKIRNTDSAEQLELIIKEELHWI